MFSVNKPKLRYKLFQLKYKKSICYQALDKIIANAKYKTQIRY